MADTTTPKWKSFFKDEATLFVIKIVAVYVVWKVIHFILHRPETGVIFKDWAAITYSFGIFYAKVTSRILHLFGQNTFQIGYAVQYQPSMKSIWIQEHCLAIPAMVIFTGSILLFKGSWKNKLWFIPVGLIGIFLINTLRLVLLSVTFERFSEAFYQFNHSYVYLIFSYSLIFLLIAWWMKSYSQTTPVKGTA
jgi:exosortase/archaeosortase family protein